MTLLGIIYVIKDVPYSVKLNPLMQDSFISSTGILPKLLDGGKHTYKAIWQKKSIISSYLG